MKICVVAPREAYLAQAGVRIRYQRIAPFLVAQGDSLEVRVIDDFGGSHEDEFDAYLFSKVYDARSYVLARRLNLAGRLIGVDLFDDYFSQVTDSRFTPQRRWLETMAKWCGFLLCSTPRMKAIAAAYMSQVPAHVMNDPCDQLDRRALGETVARKVADTMRTGEVGLAWFGNGDNPYFSVGLKDVNAFGLVLNEIRRSGFEPRLRLLTNRRALTVDGLSALGRLEVPWTLGEWSLTAEKDLLEDALVAFIPVNAQPFSIAKSLNRAVSALSSGTQVLSVGYPLYDPLGPFIYRETRSLVDDIESGSLRLRAESAGVLASSFATWADPEVEAEGLATFLEEILDRRPGGPTSRLAAQELGLGIVHGIRSGADVHRFVQRSKEMSIGGPFSPEGLNYDVRFTGGVDGAPLAMELEERVLSRLRPELAAHLERGLSRTGRTVQRLVLRAPYPQHIRVLEQARAARASQLARYAIYDAAMGATFEVLASAFPGVEFRLSEAEAPYAASSAGVSVSGPALHMGALQ